MIPAEEHVSEVTEVSFNTSPAVPREKKTEQNSQWKPQLCGGRYQLRPPPPRNAAGCSVSTVTPATSQARIGGSAGVESRVMGVWREGAGWCFCSGGGAGGRDDARSERLKAAIFSAKFAAVAAVGGGQGRGSGLLIHRNLLLTTHGNLPSAAAAEDAEALLDHGRLAARLEPHR
jgi:hypothetical protein